jgi:hypothetical protein
MSARVIVPPMTRTIMLAPEMVVARSPVSKQPGGNAQRQPSFCYFCHQRPLSGLKLFVI